MEQVRNHINFDVLPKTEVDKPSSKINNLLNENIVVNKIDYYFTNSIARSSKTMSDSRNLRSVNLGNKMSN